MDYCKSCSDYAEELAEARKTILNYEVNYISKELLLNYLNWSIENNTKLKPATDKGKITRTALINGYEWIKTLLEGDRLINLMEGIRPKNEIS